MFFSSRARVARPLLIQFRIALQVRQTVGAQFRNNWKICIKNVYNNMIEHLRSSSDCIGKFSFDSTISFFICSLAYLFIYVFFFYNTYERKIYIYIYIYIHYATKLSQQIFHRNFAIFQMRITRSIFIVL